MQFEKLYSERLEEHIAKPGELQRLRLVTRITPY